MPDDPIRAFPLIVIVDDSEFTARKPAELPLGHVHALQPRGRHRRNRRIPPQEALGLRGPLVIDARIKPHHAPPLVDDPEIERRVDQLAAPGGPLHGIY